MNLAPRSSGRRAPDFQLGRQVTAFPATVGHPLVGIVVAVHGEYTVVVRTPSGVEIAVDTEDCPSTE